MAIISTLLKKGIRLRESLEQEYSSPIDLQKQQLKKLLLKAERTEIGKKYDFHGILNTFRLGNEEFYERYKDQVPIYDYDSIHAEFWQKLQEGKKNITWPGAVKYFALSSGTSGATSKYIPITKDMVKAIRRTGVRQILSLSKYDLPDSLFSKGILMLGGSTDLDFNGTYFSGDLSGITASKLPIWLQRFYKPGKKIARNRNWGDKLDQIVKKAKDWDIGIIVGVPAWLQLLMEKIITHYGVKDIHEIWPNLQIFVHGGVSFEPYRKGFESLLGRPLIYIETYLASEGFLAFQAIPNRKSMRLVLNNGVFHEFIPFSDANFDENGNVKKTAKTLKIDEVEEGKDYALLITTCAGAWRYLIGDVVRFISKEESEIIITGRTKHFLSLCGEHLSVDNMNKAIELAAEELNFRVKEFTVLGVPYKNLFAHHWFVGSDDLVDSEKLKEALDSHLKALNDDYAVERKHALKKIEIDVLPSSLFYDWMRAQGKEGGQNKFPRVLKRGEGGQLAAVFERINFRPMIQSLWEGVSMGLLLSAIVGPVFFTLIQNSMEHGFRYAAVLALGILLSDTVYVILTFFGIKFLAEAIYFQLILGYVGGLILIGFGISSLLKKKISRPNTGGIEIPTKRKRTAFAKGFGVNGVNPFVLLFWISIASLVSTKDLWHGADISAYYFGILLTVFAIDLLKAFLAKQLSHKMTPRLMWLLNKAVGLVMIFFGLRLIWHTFGS